MLIAKINPDEAEKELKEEEDLMHREFAKLDVRISLRKFVLMYFWIGHHEKT